MSAPAQAATTQSIPPRTWIDLKCNVLGADSVLTNYYETSERRHPLKCGTQDPKVGWEHIKARHGEGGTAKSLWPDELAQFSTHPMDWHYLMDWATQVTIAEHSEGVYVRVNRATGETTSTCFMHDFYRNLPSGVSVKRVAVLVQERSGQVITSFPTEMNDYECGGEPAEVSAQAEDNSETYMHCGMVRGGCHTHLSAGKSVYFAPETGARIIRGYIRDRWEALGWENSFLGYPTISEACGLTRGGCFNHFESGSIYYSPASGAWPLGGKIRDAWATDGWENSRFGYPTSGEQHPTGAPANHRTQAFENGFMYWDGQNVTGEWTDPASNTTRTEVLKTHG